jgi:acetyl-CoA synthetase
VTPAELESLGLPSDSSRGLSGRINAVTKTYLHRSDPDEQVRLWLDLRALVNRDRAARGHFPIHEHLYRFAYEGRRSEDGPPPAWVPSPKEMRESNIGRLMGELGLRSYQDLHRWSVEHRDDFWSTMIRKLGIVFRTPPNAIRGPRSNPTRPDWLPGAGMNIAESCFRANVRKTAILYASERSATIRRVTYGELRRLASRVAHGLGRIGADPGDRFALYMPMTPESVAVYLGIVLAGGCVVGIADASAPEEFEKRARIAGAKGVFTIDSYLRDGKEQPIYEKVVKANGPPAVVLPSEGEHGVRTRRPKDLGWNDFLGEDEPFDAVECQPSDASNILFSSGTTKDPKAIPWTQTTPIKSAADAYLHHDVVASDILAWPTSFGWMMGPWLTYASLVNGATMALYVGSTTDRAFGEFVSEAQVTMLGVVPKLVRAWKAARTMEGLDWSRIRRFSSTAEPSSPDEMLYLMFLSGYKPVIEYCGGTEIGGGYITSTMVQGNAPATFSTPALGLDFVIEEEGRPARRGEVFLIPPSIGLSNELLNFDHFEEYYKDVPAGPNGEQLRRHGDQIERLGAGYFRHHGRIDDMININGVKTSSEEIRSVIANDLVYDTKPIAVDADGSGRHQLVVYAVPKDQGLLTSRDLAERLRAAFQEGIRERLNPLLAHVHAVVLIAELPQAGPGKTQTMKALRRDYLARIGRR